jgi:NAD-dependent SIR2 family protein deacetylase
MNTLIDKLDEAANLIGQADSLIISAGAGIGVDSGLPDFRGNEGFWHAYPALKQANIDFYKIANPSAFENMPRRAWGFYEWLARPNILMFDDWGWVSQRQRNPSALPGT